MDYIYEVLIIDKTEGVVNKWVESYWSDRKQAIGEAEKLWNDNENFEVRVISRKLNIRGVEANLWTSSRDKKVAFFHSDGTIEEWDDHGNIARKRF